MELNECIPCIRFADTLVFEFQRGPFRTYDGRLLYGLSGTAEVDIDGKTLLLSRGALLLFQSDTEYTIRPRKTVKLAVLDFDFTQEYSQRTEFLIPCPVDLFRKELAHTHVAFTDTALFNEPLYLKNAAFVESFLMEIIREFQQKRLYFRGKTSALFKNMLFELARADQSGTDSQDTISRTLAYIEQNIGHRVSNKEIGEALNYNPNYLNRLVLQHTGFSLHQYILHRRLFIAVNLLLNGQQPISDIAMTLGFNSPSHFSNFFKEQTGMTPNRYRQQGTL